MIYLLLSFATAEPPMSSDSTLVGVIHRHGTKACKNDGAGNIEFHGLYWQAGWVDLVGEASLAEPHQGKLVQLRGRPSEQRPPPAVLPEGYSDQHCPVPQMRSDMVEGPDGMRFRRGIEPSLPAFEVRGIEPFTGLTASARGTTARLAFENMLGRKLDDVELHAHYEGCYGKPGTKRRSETASHLDAGQRLELDVPFLLEGSKEASRKGGNTRHYRLASVWVRAVSDDAWVTIDVPARTLGLEVPECPSRRR